MSAGATARGQEDRGTAEIVAGAVVLAVSSGLPWFRRSGEAGDVLSAWQLPMWSGWIPVVVTAVSAMVVIGAGRGAVPRRWLAVAGVVGAFVGMVVIARTLLGTGVLLGYGALSPIEPNGSVDRAWGLLVAVHGAAFALIGGLRLAGGFDVPGQGGFDG